ncbi:MAG: membrane protein insertion efficiency factor YidD [Planctomycetota bacterium]|nr:membrane protein insertion efficiency factor YidD [Planctomycetota bacterium]
MKTLIIIGIRLYQRFISPFLPASCRYFPTCSHYFIGSLQAHGLLRGVYLGVGRILRCHPWAAGGDDPVPIQFKFIRARKPDEKKTSGSGD